jgi:LacI family transcriptional regulator
MKPTNGSRRVLLEDIAKATGYTVNTVSRALKDKPDIARNTRASIQKVAADMGYVRNTVASSLRSGQSRALAVIVGEASNPFYAIMIDTIHDIAEANGYTVMVFCSRDMEAQEQKAIITAIGRQVDGVLLFPGAKASGNVALLKQSGIPFVLISRHLQDPDYDYVVCDEEAGGYLAGRHLIEAGHRKVAFYYTFEVVFSSERRISGLLRATREAGIPDEDVRFFQHKNDKETVAQMKRWKAEGITGIFAFCDIEAWSLASCLEACGMAGDFALVGFDNIQGSIGFPSPLCTIDGAMRELSRAAFSILIDRIQGDQTPPKAVVFPVRLVCRGSCGAGSRARLLHL